MKNSFSEAQFKCIYLFEEKIYKKNKINIKNLTFLCIFFLVKTLEVSLFFLCNKPANMARIVFKKKN